MQVTTPKADADQTAAAFESKSFDAIPGQPAIRLKADIVSFPEEERKERLDADSHYRVQNLDDERRHKLAATLTLAMGGELLVQYEPSHARSEEECLFSVRETDLSPAWYSIHVERLFDAMAADGFIADAIIRELEAIAQEHVELAKRAKEALWVYGPWRL